MKKESTMNHLVRYFKSTPPSNSRPHRRQRTLWQTSKKLMFEYCVIAVGLILSVTVTIDAFQAVMA
jgi:hypothetical protein